MNDTTRPWALITGACGGIGRALVDEFVAAGYSVIATDIHEEPDIPDSKHVEYLSLDLAKLAEGGYEKDFLSGVRSITKGRGLKVLVNNAAVQRLGSTKDVTFEDWKSTLDVNVSAPFLLVQCLFDDLLAGTGSVVNIASVHSKATKPGFVAYSTSKAALSGLTRALAVDVGDKFRINAINLGATETEMLVSGFEGKMEMYQKLKDVHPINRVADPKDVAGIAIFLASEKASFITGATIDVDGGILSRLHDPG